MSLLERIDAREEQIEQGKRLIRIGDDRNIPFSDWLAYRLNRLGWFAPLHLRLRAHNKVRLLTVPKDPVAGDKAIGEALLTGTMVHGGESVTIEALDFADPRLSPAFGEYLQGFTWLRDLAAAATREKGARLAEKLVQKWIGTQAVHGYEREGRPDLWGRRVLFWTAYAPYILSARDVTHRAAVLKALARGIRYLERNADKAPLGLARISAWCGVIAASLLVEGSPARFRHGEAGLFRALAGSLHDDGGLISRAPVEQLQLVELLGQLRAIYYAGRRDVPERVSEALAGAAAALLGATLGDEALSSWQGGNMVAKRRIAAALEGAGMRSRPLRQARGWGYQRLVGKNGVVVFDAAPPPARRALLGACASTLAFEFSDGADRLVVNCGGAGEWKGALPPSLAHALRFTAAHSTLTLRDRNSTAIHQDGTMGRGVTQVELSRDETGGISRAEASHDGYVRRFGLIHQRSLALSGDGRELKGEDRLIAQGRRRRGEPLPYAVRFHLGLMVEVTTTADGQGALLRVRGGPAWRFRCRGGRLDIEDSLWVDGFGRTRATQQLVVSGETPPDGISISWLFSRAG
jgi:uncharacterized heparinase superfamily protein